MENREKAQCQRFVDYMTGEAPDVDRKRFERHMLTCAACREDAVEWRLVWDQLAQEAPAVDPPEDLKEQVLGSIFAVHPIQPAISDIRPASRVNKRGLLRWLAL